VAGNAALFVSPTDVDALADTLGRALSDTAPRAWMVQAGTERARQFSWQKSARRVLELYHGMAYGASGHS
jgi:glycosyltransferase involved in cell wall biosynthesis